MSQGIFKASAHPRSALRASRLHEALVAALMIGVTPFTASAATIAATSPDDSDPTATTTCTLRQAIVSMNTAVLHGNCTNSVPDDAFGTNDTITFAPSIVTGATIPGTVTLVDSADDTGNVGGTLVITAANLTIDASAWRGSGAGQFPGGITITRPTTATNNFGIVRDTAAAGASLALNGLTLSQGKVTADSCAGYSNGGGICIADANLTLTGSTVSGNSARRNGGGIYSGSGSLTLAHSTVSGNSTSGRGGGIGSSSGALTLSDSTVSGNSTAAWGGGIICYGGIQTFTNSTITGNTANFGGGIYTKGVFTLTQSSVSKNTAGSYGGGLDGVGSGTITNSIVSGNTQPSGDINLIGGWTGTNNLIGVPAATLNLGPLQDNGGPTQTMLPGVGSAAIDGVPAGSCSLATDQRGFVRPQGVLCDIGAVEVRQGTASLTVTLSGNGSVSAGASPSPISGGISGCSSSGGTNCSATYPNDETLPASLIPVALTSASGWHFVTVTPTLSACGGSLADDNLIYTSAVLTQNCALLVTLAQNQTSTVLTSDIAPSVYGQSVTFTATVAPVAPASANPTGTVSFLADGLSIGCDSQSLSATTPYVTTCTTSALAGGSHTVSAQYGGDANYPAQPIPNTLTQAVNPAATATTIAAPAPIALGQPLTVSVLVAAQTPGAGTPVGNVTVSDGGASCTAALSAGAGSCTLTPPAPGGAHTLAAVYAPMIPANFATSTGSVPLTITSATSTITLTSDLNPSTIGQSVTLTTTVTPAAGNPIPTGSVAFLDGTSAITGCATIALNAGTAECATTALSIGTHAVQASYDGDANTAPSNAMLDQVVAAVVVPAAPAVPVPTLSSWVMALLGAALAALGLGRVRRRMQG